jgi:hypothetical protein
MLKTAMALALFTTVAGAQLPEMAAGSRLKLDLVGYQKVEGTLMSQTPDTLVIAADGARVTRLPASSVGRIKSTLGKSHGAGAKKGAKIGTIIGAGFGVLLGLAVMGDDTYDYTFDKSAAPVAFGLVGAAEGAIYGVVIGAIVGAQNWKTIYERPYSASVAPAPGGVRLSVSLRP